LLKTETKLVGKYNVTTTQLMGRRALKLMAKIGDVVAPALAKAEGITSGDDIAKLAPALSALFRALSQQDLDALLLEIFPSTSVQVGERITPLTSGTAIDSVFGGDWWGIVRVAAAAIIVNFADFTEGSLPGSVEAVIQKVTGA